VKGLLQRIVVLKLESGVVDGGARLSWSQQSADAPKDKKHTALFAALPLARQEPVAAKAPKKDALREALAEVHPDEMTPREALEALYRLKGLG
jgi:DNA mismatch repair ATPase MutS